MSPFPGSRRSTAELKDGLSDDLRALVPLFVQVVRIYLCCADVAMPGELLRLLQAGPAQKCKGDGGMS